MQIPGLGEMGTTGVLAGLGMSWTPLAFLWKISLTVLLISIGMALLRFMPRAEA
jgi:hypothetical protein